MNNDELSPMNSENEAIDSDNELVEIMTIEGQGGGNISKPSHNSNENNQEENKVTTPPPTNEPETTTPETSISVHQPEPPNTERKSTIPEKRELPKRDRKRPSHLKDYVL